MFAPQSLVCCFGSGQGVVVAYELFLLIGQCVVRLACSVNLLLALVGVAYLADSIDQVDDVLHLRRNHFLKHREHNPAQTADGSGEVHRGLVAYPCYVCAVVCPFVICPLVRRVALDIYAIGIIHINPYERRVQVVEAHKYRLQI